jgi:hypothetical protein
MSKSEAKTNEFKGHKVMQSSIAAIFVVIL